VPTYHLEPNLDERTLAATDGWEISDPKAIYMWFKDGLDESRRPTARRLIKYLNAYTPPGDHRERLRWSRLDPAAPHP
jgi:hypothetical protein